MINPSMPNLPNMSNIPGMGAMTDSLEFVKNLWSSMGIPGMNVPGMNLPGMVMPTLSVDELNKRISDLKAVESWLGLNMNMLRSTIQALEVQVATISTLQAMGQNFAAAMNPAADETPAAPRSGNGAQKEHHAPEPTSIDEQTAADLTAPLVNAAAWWNMLQDQFRQAVGDAMKDTQTVAADTVKKTKAKPAAKPAATSSARTATRTTTRKRKTS
jgi:hypothetical protein